MIASLPHDDALTTWTTSEVHSRLNERLLPMTLKRYADVVRTVAHAHPQLSKQHHLIKTAKRLLAASPEAHSALIRDSALGRWVSAIEEASQAEGDFLKLSALVSLSTRFAIATALLERSGCDLTVALGSAGRARIPADGRILKGPSGARVRVRVVDGELKSFAQPAKIAGPFEVVDGDAEAGKLPVVRPLSGGAINPNVVHLEAGAAVLRETAPRLLDEAAALAPVLVGVAGQTDTSHSASLQYARGCVWLTPVRRPLVVAETLVHETSHLKYFLSEDAGSFSSTDDPARLKVPWRNDLRPLRAVLMGVHAWARVIAWLRTIERDDLRARAAQRLAILEPAVSEGLALIENDQGLSPEGQLLVRGLSELVG